jgi:hypothetical protein
MLAADKCKEIGVLTCFGLLLSTHFSDPVNHQDFESGAAIARDHHNVAVLIDIRQDMCQIVTS